MKKVDARGLSCPEPVIRTRAALKGLPDGKTISVVVDTVATRENIKRAVDSVDYAIEINEISGESSSHEFELLITKRS